MESLSTLETSPTSPTSPPAIPSSPARERRGLRRGAVTAVGIVAATAIIAAGWFYATTQVDEAGASGTFLSAVPKVTVTANPADGAIDVRPDATVSITAKFGRIISAQLLDDADQSSAGVLAPDGSAWSSAGSALASASHYRVNVKLDTPRGMKTRVSSFTTLTPTATVSARVSPGDNATVGVGQPIIMKFSDRVTNKAAVEKHVIVTPSTPVIGSWHWFSDTEAHYRPQQYWPANITVNVAANLAGVDFGSGVWGDRNITTHYAIGDAHVTTVDAASHEMTVTVNGAVARVIPASTGRNDLPTMGGTLITLDKAASVIMDSSTNGVPVDSPDGYRETVLWNVRITNSGIFVHAAPWSVSDQGRTNVSHGCVNVSEEAAQWFYNFSQLGDIVTVVNTPRPPSPSDAGSRDWNMTWAEWVGGSATPALPAS